jgi:hypothetical protein
LYTHHFPHSLALILLQRLPLRLHAPRKIICVAEQKVSVLEVGSHEGEEVGFDRVCRPRDGGGGAEGEDVEVGGAVDVLGHDGTETLAGGDDDYVVGCKGCYV